MSWKLQQLRSEGSENPAQVLSTARNAIRRVRMVMRGLPQRELTEEGKRLIGSIQHEAAQQTKEARLRCGCSSCAAAVAQPPALSCQSPPHTAAVAGISLHASSARMSLSHTMSADHWFLPLPQRVSRPHAQPSHQPVPDARRDEADPAALLPPWRQAGPHAGGHAVAGGVQWLQVSGVPTLHN